METSVELNSFYFIIFYFRVSLLQIDSDVFGLLRKSFEIKRGLKSKNSLRAQSRDFSTSKRLETGRRIIETQIVIKKNSNHAHMQLVTSKFILSGRKLMFDRPQFWSCDFQMTRFSGVQDKPPP